jgi:hypothetical protein
VLGLSGLGIEARRSVGESVGGGDAGALFYRVGGGVGRPDDGGEWVAVVVHHDGHGGGCFRRGSAGAVVMRGGGCSSRFRSGRWVPGRWRAHAHEAVVVASAIRLGEEDDRAGPACQ